MDENTMSNKIPSSKKLKIKAKGALTLSNYVFNVHPIYYTLKNICKLIRVAFDDIQMKNCLSICF